MPLRAGVLNKETDREVRARAGAVRGPRGPGEPPRGPQVLGLRAATQRVRSLRAPGRISLPSPRRASLGKEAGAGGNEGRQEDCSR